jgi:hypothetical protein
MKPSVGFPRLRWFACGWLVLWVPVYHDAYGAWHFLQLCNLGLLVGVVGVLLGSPVLLSSQAVASVVVALLWLADAGGRLLTDQHLHGGTAYMWDLAVPVAARALSLYHLGFPLLMLYCLHHTGYDPRGFVVQCLLAAAAIAIGLTLAPPAHNLNYAYAWPGAAIPHADPLLYSLLAWAMLIALCYLPVHLLLDRTWRRRALGAARAAASNSRAPDAAQVRRDLRRLDQQALD